MARRLSLGRPFVGSQIRTELLAAPGLTGREWATHPAPVGACGDALGAATSARQWCPDSENDGEPQPGLTPDRDRPDALKWDLSKSSPIVEGVAERGRGWENGAGDWPGG
jgi:hypothetical protein